MTVEQLIKALAAMPPSLPVFVIYNENDGVKEVLGVEPTWPEGEQPNYEPGEDSVLLQLEGADRRGGV